MYPYMVVFIAKGNGMYKRVNCYSEKEFETLKTNLVFDKKAFFAAPWIKSEEHTERELKEFFAQDDYSRSAE